MNRTPRSAKLAAILVAGAFVAAACGSKSSSSKTTAPETTASANTEAPTTEAPGTTLAPAAGTAMREVIDINPKAVWEDGSPITAADFTCTWEAALNTPKSIATTGYDQITAVTAGTSDKQVIVDFKTVYAPYRGLFGGIIKKAAVQNCNDISGDFQQDVSFSGRALKLQSFSKDQMVLVPNDKFWGTPATVKKVVIVPKADQSTEIASLKSGEVDFIYPQYTAGILDSLKDANIKNVTGFGGQYEGLYFQEKSGPFADATFRKAFALSIDRDALFNQIYAPLVPNAKLLQCGAIVPGPYCDDAFASVKADPAQAASLLTAAGWKKNAKGLWEDKTGKVPTIRWMVNAGNSRRENTQAYLIPLLKTAGFNVVADNCDAACVFQKRLPALDYDLGMYISVAPPDPGYLTSSFACDQIPSAANNNQGQNQTGWCNQAATDDLHNADKTIDETKRAALIKDVMDKMAQDLPMLPLFQFPTLGSYRTDKLSGPVEAELNNYEAFKNLDQWVTSDSSGQVTIGAEQWPDCLNPVTDCANSSWQVWMAGDPLLPGVYDTTNDGGYKITDLVTAEPTVTVLNAG